MGAKDLKLKGEAVSHCMLEQSMFTVLGVLSGVALGVRRKAIKPFVGLSLLGTTMDLGYGQIIACRDLIDDYNECAKAVKAAKAAAATPKNEEKKAS